MLWSSCLLPGPAWCLVQAPCVLCLMTVPSWSSRHNQLPEEAGLLVALPCGVSSLPRLHE